MINDISIFNLVLSKCYDMVSALVDFVVNLNTFFGGSAFLNVYAFPAGWYTYLGMTKGVLCDDIIS